MPTTKALEIAQFAGKTTVDDGTGDITVTGLAGGADISTSSIDDLQDVVVTTPSTGQVLKYNGTNWVNSTDAQGSDQLETLLYSSLVG